MLSSTGLTLGGTVQGDPAKDIILAAFNNGINMFDTAESYSEGKSELEMGRVLRELDIPRSDLVITTKIFWGGSANKASPNAWGLSRKHIIEGTRESLDRLGLEYVDVVFAHRCDVNVGMEEMVRAFNWVIEKGWAHYWATSEWSAQQIEEAHGIAQRYGLHAPIADQCEHRWDIYLLSSSDGTDNLIAACSAAKDPRKNTHLYTRNTAWARRRSAVSLEAYLLERFVDHYPCRQALT